MKQDKNTLEIMMLERDSLRREFKFMIEEEARSKVQYQITVLDSRISSAYRSLDKERGRMYLDGDKPLEMEVVSTQEEGKSETFSASKRAVPIPIEDKESFYLMAIKKDEKNIAAAKERIKNNKIRLRKLLAYLKKKKQIEIEL